jgi:hypothetical protein
MKKPRLFFIVFHPKRIASPLENFFVAILYPPFSKLFLNTLWVSNWKPWMMGGDPRLWLDFAKLNKLHPYATFNEQVDSAVDIQGVA